MAQNLQMAPQFSQHMNSGGPNELNFNGLAPQTSEAVYSRSSHGAGGPLGSMVGNVSQLNQQNLGGLQ